MENIKREELERLEGGKTVFKKPTKKIYERISYLFHIYLIK